MPNASDGGDDPRHELHPYGDPAGVAPDLDPTYDPRKDNAVRTIGVMGSAGGGLDIKIRKRCYDLGVAIAQAGCVLITGACPGLPYDTARGAKAAGGLSVGISPALSRSEHVLRYDSPVDEFDVIIYTGSGLMGREVDNIHSSDIVIIVGGRSGTLGEFAIAYDEGKLIGILAHSAGIADDLPDIVPKLRKKTGARLIYEADPTELISQCIAVYQREHYKHPSVFVENPDRGGAHMARITFIGAAGVVTGSKHLLETDTGARVLLDCGLYQGLRELTERNWTPPPVDPARLDAVLLSHGHLDHCGYLPALVQQGFHQPIYCTPATADVTELVLRDSAGLQEDEAARAAKHPERGLHTTPLYTEADVDKVVPLFSKVGYDDMRDDIPGCRFRFNDAGHILGSAIMEIFFDTRKLVFTGDLGRYGRPLLRDPSVIAQADYVLCESTYGDRLHPQNDPQDDLCTVINDAQQRKGVLVIPCFAIGRTQEVLYAIGRLQAESKIGSDIAIYVDSPMGISADAIMERHPEATRFNLRDRFGPGDLCIGAKHTTNVTTQQDSIALNDIQAKAIIIASSGMAFGGRVLHHLRNRLSRPNDTVCLVGFQSPGTLGQQLLSGQKKPSVMGVPVQVNATITHIDGFSAHADRDELLRWFGGFACKPTTYIVHADPKPAASLAAAVHDKYGIDASPAQQGEVVHI